MDFESLILPKLVSFLDYPSLCSLELTSATMNCLLKEPSLWHSLLAPLNDSLSVSLISLKEDITYLANASQSASADLILQTVTDMMQYITKNGKKVIELYPVKDCYYLLRSFNRLILATKQHIGGLRKNGRGIVSSDEYFDFLCKRSFAQLKAMFPAQQNEYSKPFSVLKIEDPKAQEKWSKSIGTSNICSFSVFWRKLIYPHFKKYVITRVHMYFAYLLDLLETESLVTSYKWNLLICSFGPYDEFFENFRNLILERGFVGHFSLAATESLFSFLSSQAEGMGKSFAILRWGKTNSNKGIDVSCWTTETSKLTHYSNSSLRKLVGGNGIGIGNGIGSSGTDLHGINHGKDYIQAGAIVKYLLSRNISLASVKFIPSRTHLDGVASELKSIWVHNSADLKEEERPLISLPLIPTGSSPSSTAPIAIKSRGDAKSRPHSESPKILESEEVLMDANEDVDQLDSIHPENTENATENIENSEISVPLGESPSEGRPLQKKMSFQLVLQEADELNDNNNKSSSPYLFMDTRISLNSSPIASPKDEKPASSIFASSTTISTSTSTSTSISSSTTSTDYQPLLSASLKDNIIIGPRPLKKGKLRSSLGDTKPSPQPPHHPNEGLKSHRKDSPSDTQGTDQDDLLSSYTTYIGSRLENSSHQRRTNYKSNYVTSFTTPTPPADNHRGLFFSNYDTFVHTHDDDDCVSSDSSSSSLLSSTISESIVDNRTESPQAVHSSTNYQPYFSRSPPESFSPLSTPPISNSSTPRHTVTAPVATRNVQITTDVKSAASSPSHDDIHSPIYSGLHNSYNAFFSPLQIQDRMAFPDPERDHPENDSSCPISPHKSRSNSASHKYSHSKSNRDSFKKLRTDETIKWFSPKKKDTENHSNGDDRTVKKIPHLSNEELDIPYPDPRVLKKIDSLQCSLDTMRDKKQPISRRISEDNHSFPFRKRIEKTPSTPIRGRNTDKNRTKQEKKNDAPIKKKSKTPESSPMMDRKAHKQASPPDSKYRSDSGGYRRNL